MCHLSIYLKRTAMSIEEEIFDEAYELTLKHLHARAELEDFDISLVEGELVHLQRYEGQDWSGRGEIKNSEISAQVTAYQVFLYRWKQKT